jgi:hypothetical protein
MLPASHAVVCRWLGVADTLRCAALLPGLLHKGILILCVCSMPPSVEDGVHGGETDLNVTEGFCAPIGGADCCDE